MRLPEIQDFGLERENKGFIDPVKLEDEDGFVLKFAAEKAAGPRGDASFNNAETNFQMGVVYGKDIVNGEDFTANEYLVNTRAGVYITRQSLVVDESDPAGPHRMTEMKYRDMMLSNYRDANNGNARNLRYFGRSKVSNPSGRAAIAGALERAGKDPSQTGKYTISPGGLGWAELNFENPMLEGPTKLAESGHLGGDGDIVHVSRVSIYVSDEDYEGVRYDLMIEMKN